ncbi:MBL fold metallo-hydrolase [Paenibacillus sp. GCM10012303]|uniref:MBL fold metallo-hydrolase n=1 Tax=Paenibacillus sp. GCM10012303 TaxID=3317340 RepID=UPI00361CFFF0
MKRIRNWLRKLAVPAALGFSLLLAAGCSPTSAVESGNGRTAVAKAPFYDMASNQGKLSIRYFHLQSQEKSGDAILITSPEGKQLLVDAGIPETGPKLEEQLTKLGVNKLDLVVNTHPHIDHIGGLPTLLHTKTVDRLIHNGIPHQTETYRKVQSILQEKQIPHEAAAEGMKIEWSPSVSIEVLNPPQGTTPDKYEKWGTEEHNNHSLVLMMAYGDNRILLTGDLYKTQEYALADKYGGKLKADLLHAPHHGDMTSSSGTFIKAVNPGITVLSANFLQSMDVLKRYEKEGATVYNTGKNGHLLFVADGKTLSAYPEKP